MKDNISMNQLDKELLNLNIQYGTLSDIHMTGQSIDRIYKKGVLVEERVGHNLVVNSFLNLVMCLLKQESGYSGLQYWAVGSGNSSWDDNTPTPEIDATRLTSEIGRVPISINDLRFLDSNYNEVSNPTNILQISHTFGINDCNGTWREFGIFGGNATEILNSGIMINKRHHAVINKTDEMTIDRIMRFTLNLV